METILKCKIGGCGIDNTADADCVGCDDLEITPLKAQTAPASEVPCSAGVISPPELKDAYWELMCIACTIKKRNIKNEEVTESDFKYLSEAILKVNMILNEVGL